MRARNSIHLWLDLSWIYNLHGTLTLYFIRSRNANGINIIIYEIGETANIFPNV